MTADQSVTGEPAFPALEATGVDGQYGLQFRGLTKREYFAAMAMQGFVHSYFSVGSRAEQIAKVSVEYADALLKELHRV